MPVKVTAEQVRFVHQCAMKQARLQEFLFKHADERTAAGIVGRFNGFLDELIRNGEPLAPAAQRIKDQGPLEADVVHDEISFRPRKKLYVCKKCDAVSEPIAPAFPGSTVYPNPPNWTWVAAGGTVTYLCPDCKEG